MNDEQQPTPTGKPLELLITDEVNDPVDHTSAATRYHLDGRVVRDGDLLEVHLGFNCWVPAHFKCRETSKDAPEFVLSLPESARKSVLPLLLPSWEPLFRWPRRRAIVGDSIDLLDMKDAIAALVVFGQAYGTACVGSFEENDQQLMLACQLLLTQLTGLTARPEDVEAVFPHNVTFSDA